VVTKIFQDQRIKVIFIFIILFFPLITFSQEKIPIYIKGKEIWVELAQTPEQRAKGLMWREKLGNNEGMLFIFEAEGYHSFWMKNTYIALSIAFIDKEGKIVEIREMEPLSTESHSPPKPILYALEMKRGWFFKNGIKKGDIVRFSK